MRAQQQTALNELERSLPGHSVGVRYICPGTRRVSCTCGWTITIRHTNAMAIYSKAHKAMRLHLLERRDAILAPLTRIELERIAY